jgi:hypothetical protein
MYPKLPDDVVADIIKQVDMDEKYRRFTEKIEQEMLDRREIQVMALLRALPASDESITEMRDGLLQVYMDRGASMREAHKQLIEFLEQAYTLDIFGPDLMIREDSE